MRAARIHVSGIKLILNEVGDRFWSPLFLLLLGVNTAHVHFPVQVDDCGFSLNHPNQFFMESQRILNGGKDIKKEPIQLEAPPPQPSVPKTKDAPSALAALNSSLEMDMEGLEHYFSEWFLGSWSVTLSPHQPSPRPLKAFGRPPSGRPSPSGSWGSALTRQNRALHRILLWQKGRRVPPEIQPLHGVI